MRTANQHEDDAMDFVSRAFTGTGEPAELLAAARVEATLAVAAAISELATVLLERG